jgi:hypothetical protein
VRTRAGDGFRKWHVGGEDDRNMCILTITIPRSALQSRLQKSKDSMPQVARPTRPSMMLLLQGLMREVLETYKPNLLTRRRRLIEDFVRDLMLNNDHIHVVEQQMR